MTKKINQFNNSFINDDGPSRFVVDLKQQLEESKAKKSKHVWQIKGRVKDFYYKLIDIIRRSPVPREERELWSHQYKATRWLTSHQVADSLKNLHNKYEYKFNQLAFFFLFKYLFLFFSTFLKWFYKLCYGAGWLAVFIVKFVWLAGLSVSKPVRQLVIKLRANINIKLPINILKGKLASFKGFLLRRERGRNDKKIERCVQNNPFPRKERDRQETAAEQEEAGRKFKVNRTMGPSVTLGTDADLGVKFNKHANGLRPALSFAIILLILVLPFKALSLYKSFDLSNLRASVLGVTEAAISELAEAGSSVAELQLGQASENFSSAGNNFLQAQNELNKINDLLFVLASYAPDEKLRLASNAKYILAAGQAASDLGKELSMAMEGLFSGDKDLIDVLNNFGESGDRIVKLAENLREQLDQINVNTLPAEYREQFSSIKDKAIFMEKGLNEFVDLISKMQAFLGVNQDKRYLLIFQNNTEMRASGGFIGSYALIDFSNGEIKNIEAPGGGSYDTEAGLYERVIAPEPLHLVNPLWHFWDANWWPDWEKSAKKLMWFYERSDCPTVDGAIAFTPTVIEKVLSAIGPIDMTDNYGVIIDAENFWLTTQEIAERKPEYISPPAVESGQDENIISTSADTVKHEPKKIIGDLMNKIIEELPARLNKDTFIALIKALEESLSQKHILFYFTDNELQQKAADMGWDGRIRQTNWDYLMVINTNIAGGKSDKKIKEVINHSAKILEDGSIINTVEIKRTHTGIKREPFCGVRNVNWMRVYVPIGSELIEARGFDRPDEVYFEEPDKSWQTDRDLYFESAAQIHWPSKTKIYDESWKTVFANWTMVDPGETITIYFKYKLPFKLEKTKKSYNIIDQVENYLNPEQKLLYPYALLAQKQSGSIGSEINSTLKLPDNFEIIWQYPDGMDTSVNGWSVSDSLETDKYWAVIMNNE